MDRRPGDRLRLLLVGVLDSLANRRDLEAVGHEPGWAVFDAPRGEAFAADHWAQHDAPVRGILGRGDNRVRVEWMSALLARFLVDHVVIVRPPRSGSGFKFA